MKYRNKLFIKTTIILLVLAIGASPTSTYAADTGNQEFLDALDAAFKIIIDGAKYDQIYSKWMSSASVLVDDSTSDTATSFPDAPDSGTLADIIAAGEIVFGSDMSYPPMEYMNGTTPIGFDVDMTKAIAEEFSTAYGKTITSKMKNSDWDPIIPNLKTGEFDALISSMTKTESRAKEIDFTRCYYTSKQAILRGTLDNASVTISSAADLDDASIKIGLQSGTTSDLYAADNFAAVVSGFSLFPDAIQALDNGDVHVVLTDLPVAEFYALDNATQGFSVVGTFGDNENFGIGVRKDKSEDDGFLPIPIAPALLAILAIPIFRRFRK